MDVDHLLPSRAPRQRARQNRAIEKIDALIEATVRVLETEGEAGVRVAAICDRVGVSYGSVYHHFGDREGLIRAAQFARLRAQPGQDIAAQQSRLFLAVLKGDRSGLERDFALTLEGDSQHWTLHLAPRALLLQQIFSAIRIEGGALVERIELIETQGDRTVLKMPQSQAGDALTEQERADLVP